MVEMSGCAPDLDPTRLSEALEVELKNLGPALVEHIRTSAPRARVQCQLQHVAVIVETRDGEALRERLSLSEQGLLRFIAIAVSESLAAQVALRRVAAAPEPVAPAATTEPEAVPAPAPPPPPRPQSPTWRWGAAGLLRFFGEPDLTSAGLRAGLDARLHTHLAVGANLETTASSRRVEGGKISVTTFSLAAEARYVWVRGRFQLHSGVGARSGAVLWRGTPNDPERLQGQTGLAAWGGPYGVVLSSVDVTPNALAEFGLEAGANPSKVDATRNESRIATLGQFWLTMLLGIKGKF